MRSSLLSLLILIGAPAAPATAAAAHWRKGVVFGGGEWSSPDSPYGSPSAATALAALAATGADHVRILTTQYQDFINSTAIGPIFAPSPLASSGLEALRGAVRGAHALGLAVFLAPILDPSWDIPQNGRSITPPAGATPVSRLQIGLGFSEAQWGAWFESYSAYLLPLAQLAKDEGVEMFEVCSELDVALTTRGAQWRALIASVRVVYGGPLYVAANPGTLANITFFDALDAIGVDAYYGLGETLPLGVAPTVDELVTAWQPIRDALAALSRAAGDKPVLLTEVGYQSRPSCHVRPWGTVVHDPLDDSAWLEDHDMACQANAYEALLRVFTAEPWFGGVFWWLWRADATHGGTYDSDFTPHGKPAEGVLRRWYGGNLTAGDPTGAGAVAAAVRAAMPAAPATHAGTRRTYNGFVFGGPDQWSSPFYRYDSAGAAASLEAMQTGAGADTAEIIVQMYVDSVNSTEVYPITDPANPLRTSTDDELRAIIATAHARGLKTVFTLMLDPAWTLPSQNWCRGNPNGDPNCHWRGEIGIYWGTDCSPASQWAAFFRGYTAAVVHYAQLAAEAGVDAYLLSHELLQAVTVCPDLWLAQLTAVRAVYGGRVSTAFNPDGPAVLPAAVAAAPWVQALDFIGVDCYFSPPLPPWSGGGGLSPSDVHPPLPWQDVNMATLLAAFAALMPPLAALAAATGGKKIVCTEVGWASRPWTYAYRAGTPRLDGEDCSVWDQCVSAEAQAMAYSAFLQTYSAQPWYDGVLFWDWRADPTAGGLSDDGFTPSGKAAANVTRQFWGAAVAATAAL